MSILRYEENGIEFFTVQATGESGMSQSGLARLCGVRPDAVNKLLKGLMTSFCPEFLKPLQGMDLTLMASVHEFKNVTILRDTVCAQILEWYAFESQRPNETARQAFRKFASMGIRTWIQGITGWEKGTEALTLEPQPEPKPEIETVKSDLAQIAQGFGQLEHSLLVALKHCHAIHNIVEQPTVVDLSLQQIIHTAVHVQAKTLNEALKQLTLLRDGMMELDFSSLMDADQTNQYNQFWQEVGTLRAENEALTRRLAILQSQRSTVPYTSPEQAKMNLEERIEWLTEALLSQQKRPDGDRAKKICQLQATILARYEAGESLKAIADELGLGYETVKTYSKRSRASLRLQVVTN
jgi:transcriptional regulator with XRE-family HTH domain